eukprot:TRINITY_DN6593_c0_g1_i3.p2 TRINITY_DN6593_c0_g1~~TRINITY_DN6593_c0_g1_i3.p2  ORF type:complete len:125 (-),score=19.17 TRINITY_DN6593_c0_g1_i3:46-420(-)
MAPRRSVGGQSQRSVRCKLDSAFPHPQFLLFQGEFSLASAAPGADPAQGLYQPLSVNLSQNSPSALITPCRNHRTLHHKPFSKQNSCKLQSKLFLEENLVKNTPQVLAGMQFLKNLKHPKAKAL